MFVLRLAVLSAEKVCGLCGRLLGSGVSCSQPGVTGELGRCVMVITGAPGTAGLQTPITCSST